MQGFYLSFNLSPLICAANKTFFSFYNALFSAERVTFMNGILFEYFSLIRFKLGVINF